MSNWSLPWHYLSSTFTLVQGDSVNGNTLISRLIPLGEEPFTNALAPTQTWNSAEGLFSHVRALSQYHTKPGYGWGGSWPWSGGSMGDLHIKIRTGVPLRDAILTPEALILPWPFRGVGSAQLVALANTANIYIPALNELGPDFDLNSGFYLNALMKAADDCIAPASDYRTTFLDGKSDCGAATSDESRTKLTDRARVTHGHTLGYPPNLSACVDGDRSNRECYWNKVDNQLHFVFGSLKKDEPCPGFALPHDNHNMGIDGSHFVPAPIDKWPDGAYCNS